jgi:hypothetical protein
LSWEWVCMWDISSHLSLYWIQNSRTETWASSL